MIKDDRLFKRIIVENNGEQREIVLLRLERDNNILTFGKHEKDVFTLYPNSCILKVPETDTFKHEKYLESFIKYIKKDKDIFIKHHPDDSYAFYTKDILSNCINFIRTDLNFSERKVYVLNNLYTSFVNLFNIVKEKYNEDYKGRLHLINVNNLRQCHYILGIKDKTKECHHPFLVTHEYKDITHTEKRKKLILSNNYGKIKSNDIDSFI